MNADVLEPESLHRFKNQMGIAIGYCHLLLDEMGEADPRHRDLQQVLEAMAQAMTLLPEISPESSSAALAAHVRVMFPISWRDKFVALGSYSRHREAGLHGRIAQ